MTTVAVHIEAEDHPERGWSATVTIGTEGGGAPVKKFTGFVSMFTFAHAIADALCEYHPERTFSLRVKVKDDDDCGMLKGMIETYITEIIL